MSGFLLIFFSEIGDKTFFIALLLALRNSRSAVFAGTFGALAVMSVVSVLLGQALHTIDELVPAGDSALYKLPYDDILAAALLIWFGIQTLQVQDLMPCASCVHAHTCTWTHTLCASHRALHVLTRKFMCSAGCCWRAGRPGRGAAGGKGGG